ncbi:DODA-type extradiol aromatic ring-opening family dioxygenase [Vibrio maerlii]|uniref:DODA-type extradiol aromatic ring-opening family dioxygenase n=1 Tax=Vibrio maerlii TaxID=2231648 RepID=UPI0019D11F29|nr:class III extradiol ring-cleavage dioxygenase [Vibrio maerlii]
MGSKPDAIVIISAHWEASQPTVNAGFTPNLLFDYTGFPDETYQYTYPAPGNPVIADMILDLFKQYGINSKSEIKRGWDHGVFVPLKLAFPQADIPIVQLSLLNSMNAKSHIEMGKALRSLMQHNILVIGSGFTFHNLRSQNWDDLHKSDPDNEAFQEWLTEVCTCEMNEEERLQRLIEWENAPAARYCHPREEHLLPLHVCQGIANQKGKIVFDDKIAGKRCLGVLWGDV